MTGNIEKGMSAIISADKKFVPKLEQIITQDTGSKVGTKTAIKLANIDISVGTKIGTKSISKLANVNADIGTKIGTKSAAKLAEIKIARKSKKSKAKVKGKKRKN